MEAGDRRNLKVRTTATNRWLATTLHMGNLHEVSRKVNSWTRQPDAASQKKLQSQGLTPSLLLTIAGGKLFIDASLAIYERNWSNQLRAGFTKTVAQAKQANLKANETVNTIQSEMVAKQCP